MLITRIVRDSILDGPGCRYTIFVKGCPLRCEWCHNPENQRIEQEVITYEKFCIRCGLCLGVVEGESDQMPVYVEDTTDPRYFRCAEICPTNALSLVGREYTVDWLLGDLLKYRVIYRRTGGGLTISGGEPLMGGDFSYELCEKAKSAGIHTAIDTSGALPWEVLKRFLSVVDLWLYDLKHIDDPAVESELNIANFKRLAGHKREIAVRIPVIPGYNDNEKVFKEMAELVRAHRKVVTGVYLLPFHPYATPKYIALHRQYKFRDKRGPGDVTLKEAKSIFRSYLPETPVSIGRAMVHG